MNPKTTHPVVERKEISYQSLSELLLKLQVDFMLFAEETPPDHKCVQATSIKTKDSLMLHFEDSSATISIDFARKGGIR